MELDIDSYAGSLLGLAVGDALGTTLEFSPPGTFEPIDDIIGGGPFHLKPGEWTDDTSMALCLAESLIERSGFDPRDQMERYVRWSKEGHLSSIGYCFDIGNTVAQALRVFQSTGEPYAGSTQPDSAGNGSIMRLAPVPLAFANDPLLAVTRSAESSKTTHGVRAAVDACRYLGMLIVGAVRGEGKGTLLGTRYTAVPGYWDEYPLVDEIDEIALGSYKFKQPPEITGTGFVVKSLEAALWAFYTTGDFREGCLRAVNLGNDADTTGAVYGQLAGAYYGNGGIPVGWREKIAHRSLIESFSQGLLIHAQRITSPTRLPPPVPHPRTYWAESGRLLAGFYPGDQSAAQARVKLRALLLGGIDSFIDLTEDGELLPYEHELFEVANDLGVIVEYQRYPICDLNVPTAQEMRLVLDTIASDLQDGKTVYVHCRGGIGRTGTVVGCHLVEQGWTGQEALETIRVLRSSVPGTRLSPETKTQREMVLNWA